MSSIDNTYAEQNLKQTWSYKAYNVYKRASSTWKWTHLPFGGPRLKKGDWAAVPPSTKGPILEIGSAAGGAYAFLKESGVVDTSDYTGIEISDIGINHCRETYREAEWLQQNMVEFEPTRNYDYVFERIAVHHMAEPLKIFDRLLKHTNVALSTTFASCFNGGTISDLDVARYRHPNGDYVYFNIINAFEVIELMFLNGFNEVSMYYWGAHPKVDYDPLAHQYMSPEIKLDLRMAGRVTLVGHKAQIERRVIHVTHFRHSRKLWKRFREHKVRALIKDRCERMSGKRNGAIYRSMNAPVD